MTTETTAKTKPAKANVAKRATAKATSTAATKSDRRPPAPAMFAPKLRWADDTPIDDEGAKGRILNAAVECVLRFGVDKTGMDDVARAANITRQTVYKHFSSRNELIISVFLRVLDDRLQRGLETFFDNPDSADALRDGIADAAAHVLDVLRNDETIQAILFGSRIAPEVLLAETATILVGVLQVSLTRSMGAVVTGDLLRLLRPTPLEDVSGWIIRMLYGFLAWPGESLEAERALFRQYLTPIFLLDEA
jgi:AcrR family transcriptional regulator